MSIVENINFSVYSQMATTSTCMRNTIHRSQRECGSKMVGIIKCKRNAYVAHIRTQHKIRFRPKIAIRKRSKNNVDIYEKHKLTAPKQQMRLVFICFFLLLLFYMDFNEEKLIGILSSAYNSWSKWQQMWKRKKSRIVEWFTRKIRCKIKLDHRCSFFCFLSSFCRMTTWRLWVDVWHPFFQCVNSARQWRVDTIDSISVIRFIFVYTIILYIFTIYMYTFSSMEILEEFVSHPLEHLPSFNHSKNAAFCQFIHRKIQWYLVRNLLWLQWWH